MKVVFILNKTLRLSGSFKSFMVLLRGLMQRGVQPYIVMPRGQDYEDELRSMGLPVLLLTYRDHAWPHSQTWRQKLLFVPRLIARFVVNSYALHALVRHFSHEDIALVHTNVSVIGIGYQLARCLGVPHVYHIREYGKEDFGIRPFPSKRAFDKRLIRSGSYSICITRDILRYHHLEGHASARMIYNGIHDRTVNMPPTSRARSYFLFVGPLTYAKGIDQLVEAYIRYASGVVDPCPLYVVGQVADEPLYERLKSEIAFHGQTSNVRFLGTRDDVPQLMSDALAVIVASPSEGFGRCTAEALFCGTLVIGRNTGGTREQMDNGLLEWGKDIALRYETTDELVALLRQVATCWNPTFDDMCNRAFLTANRLYTNEAYIGKVFDFYAYILGLSEQ